MNEQEILTQLRKAAEEIEIPEALKPEQIEKQLQEQKAKQQQENQHLKLYIRYFMPEVNSVAEAIRFPVDFME